MFGSCPTLFTSANSNTVQGGCREAGRAEALAHQLGIAIAGTISTPRGEEGGSRLLVTCTWCQCSRVEA